jgi:hypothetical protein
MVRSNSSNLRPDTLMRDRLPPARQNPLATHGRTIHWVKRRPHGPEIRLLFYPQNRTSSGRPGWSTTDLPASKSDFRSGPETGHRRLARLCHDWTLAVQKISTAWRSKPTRTRRGDGLHGRSGPVASHQWCPRRVRLASDPSRICAAQRPGEGYATHLPSGFRANEAHSITPAIIAKMIRG